MVNLYTAGQFHTFLYLLGLLEFYTYFLAGKRKQQIGGFASRDQISSKKTKIDSFPNFEHLTEEGRSVGGGKVLILVHIYSKQIWKE